MKYLLTTLFLMLSLVSKAQIANPVLTCNDCDGGTMNLAYTELVLVNNDSNIVFEYTTDTITIDSIIMPVVGTISGDTIFAYCCLLQDSGFIRVVYQDSVSSNWVEFKCTTMDLIISYHPEPKEQFYDIFGRLVNNDYSGICISNLKGVLLK